MSDDVIDIKYVPHSPGTSFNPVFVKNPGSTDFTHKWDGQDYTIPARSKKSFPEFLARHLSKHLAQALVIPAFVKELQALAQEAPTEQLKDQIMNRSVPPQRLLDKQKELLEYPSTSAQPLDDTPEPPSDDAPSDLEPEDELDNTDDLAPEDDVDVPVDPQDIPTKPEDPEGAEIKFEPETPELVAPATAPEPQALTPEPVQ